MKTFTVGDIINAIEKDGLPKIKAWYFHYRDGGNTNIPLVHSPVTGACAIGQACVNLGVDTTWQSKEYAELVRFLSRITVLNDHTDSSFEQIASQLREEYKEHLNVTVTADSFDWKKDE